MIRVKVISNSNKKETRIVVSGYWREICERDIVIEEKREKEVNFGQTIIYCSQFNIHTIIQHIYISKLLSIVGTFIAQTHTTHSSSFDPFVCNFIIYLSISKLSITVCESFVCVGVLVFVNPPLAIEILRPNVKLLI